MYIKELGQNGTILRVPTGTEFIEIDGIECSVSFFDARGHQLWGDTVNLESKSWMDRVREQAIS